MSGFKSYVKALSVGLLSVALLSCAEKDRPDVHEHVFKLETRAVQDLPSNTTYTVAAYNGTGTASLPYLFVSSGTYRSDEGDDVLVSCELDPNGNVISDNASSALNGMDGSYFLVLASPGKAINSDGSFLFTPDDQIDDLKFNRPMLAALGNYGAVTFKNPLYDNRTKVSFKIYKNISESVENITVTEAYVTSVNAENETVAIYPATRQVKVADLQARRSLSLTDKGRVKDDTGNLLFYESQQLIVASGYYAPKNNAASYLGLGSSGQNVLVESDYVYFGCLLKQGNRDAVSIRIPLNATSPELKPQMEYVYRITISSNYISLALDIYDMDINKWQDGGEFEEEISRPVDSYSIGTWEIDDWDEVDDDLNQLI